MSDYFSDGVSRRAFARDIGVDEKTVRNLISKGILATDSNLQISLSQGRKAYNTYKKKQEQASEKIEKISKKIGADLKGKNSQDFKKLLSSWLNDIDSNPGQVLNSAKAYLTALQVQEQRMKVEEMEKRLIPIERINHDAEEIGTLIRSKLITIPSRGATVCEGRTARDIEEIIDIEINKALEELQKLFVQL